MIDPAVSRELSAPMAERLDHNLFVLLGTQAIDSQDNSVLLAKRDNAGWELAKALVDPILSEATAEHIESSHHQLSEVPGHAVYAYWSVAKKAKSISETANVPSSFMHLLGRVAYNSGELDIAFDATIPAAELPDEPVHNHELRTEELDDEVDRVDLLYSVADYNFDQLELFVNDNLEELSISNPLEFRALENTLAVHNALPDKLRDYYLDHYEILSVEERAVLTAQHDLELLNQIGNDLLMLHDFITQEEFLSTDGIAAAYCRQDALRFHRDLGDYEQLSRDLHAGKFKTKTGRKVARDELDLSGIDPE